MKPLPQPIQKLVASIKRQPAKSGTLGVMLFALAILGSRTLLKDGPATALATSVLPSGTSANTGSGVLPGAQQLREVESWLERPLALPPRNLFAVQYDFFPRSSQAKQVIADRATDQDFWGRLDKSLLSAADQKKREQIRAENLHLAASRLKLQSTVMGEAPRAMINGRLVSTLDQLEAPATAGTIRFTVRAIEAQRVLIEAEGVTCELLMGQ